MNKNFMKKLDAELQESIEANEPQDPVVQVGDSILRAIAKPVPDELIGGKTLNDEIQRIKDVLFEESYDGVALAAPQLGISKRMFVVAGRILMKESDTTVPDDMVCINPEIIKTSSKTVLLEEGCISIRMVYGTVKRYTNVTLRYQDEYGKPHIRGAGGFLAHIFQHEVDHLDGILFIDRAQSHETLTGKDRKEYELRRKQHIEHINRGRTSIKDIK